VADPMTPDWFRDRLHKQLVEVQQPEAAFFDDYYTGNHPLPWLAPRPATSSAAS
jgi:hypothetical protein